MRSQDVREAVEHGRDQTPEARGGQSRETGCRFHEDELRAMRIVGAFRAVDGREIDQASVQRLLSRGLMKRKTVFLRRGAERPEVVGMTAKGPDLRRIRKGAGEAPRGFARRGET